MLQAFGQCPYAAVSLHATNNALTYSKQCTLYAPSDVHYTTKQFLLPASTVPLECTKQRALYALRHCAVPLLAYTPPALC